MYDLFFSDGTCCDTIYLPGNTLNFNQHPTGLTKELWSDDTRKVCHDMKIGFETAGGMQI